MTENNDLQGFSQSDLAELSSRYIKGESINEIADGMNRADVEILRGLQLVYENLKNAVLFKFDDVLIRQLAKLDLTESEAWKAFEASKTPRVKKSTKAVKGIRGQSADINSDDTKPDIMEQSQSTEQREGNPIYLNIVMRCIEQRVSILRLK
jgi:hypothetical protein